MAEVKKKSAGRGAGLAALLLTALVVALHGWRLAHAGGLWRDEVNLVNLAASGSVAAMAQDAFPVLMPLLVHGWQALGWGGTDFGLRCLGALIGLGLVAALWAGAWTARRRAPWLGLTLFALNSTVLLYGDALRSYGLGSCFIVLTFAAAAAFVNQPSLGRAMLFAAAAVASVQALFQNAPLVLAIAAGAAAVLARRKDWRRAAGILLAGLPAALSLLPYRQNFTASTDSATLRVGFQPDVIRDNLAVLLGFPLPCFAAVWLALGAVTIVAGILVLRAKNEIPRRTNTPAARAEIQLFAAVTLLVALLVFGGFLVAAALPTKVWYFLPVLALAAATLDAGLPELPPRFRSAAAGGVAATALTAALFVQRDAELRSTNADHIAQQLAIVAAPGDYVLVSPWFCGISFERYFKSPTPWTTLPPLADHRTHRYDLVGAQMQNPAALAPVLEKISATLAAGHRVWVVGWMEIPAPDAKPPTPLPPPPLRHTGWSDMPYAITWAAQAAHHLRQNARTFAAVKLPAYGPVNPDEDLQLFIAEGTGASVK